jgi:hypothetical protein
MLVTKQSIKSKLSLALFAVLVAGCGGGDKIDRQRIQGTVTYQGQPVAFGAIFFEPTASAGQVAPTVYLPVRDGKFDTGDKGPSPGKYRVTVGGVDQSKATKDDDGITTTPPLFPDHKFEIDVPVPNNTLNVEVPSTTASATN